MMAAQLNVAAQLALKRQEEETAKAWEELRGEPARRAGLRAREAAGGKQGALI